jgi:hypothetical protein
VSIIKVRLCYMQDCAMNLQSQKERQGRQYAIDMPIVTEYKVYTAFQSSSD